METLPKYPRTKHLPFEANASRDDLIASEKECEILFKSDNIVWESKNDGANVGIRWENENPIIRNRNHILNKGYLKDTPAKKQFRPLWNWAYDNYKNFKKLEETLGFTPSVYGEWLYATHGIEYDVLPSYFIAYDIYDAEKGYFIASNKTREVLLNCGFHIPVLIHQGKIKSYKDLVDFRDRKSEYSTKDMIEGVYVKVYDEEKVINRFKIVRNDFICGEHWTKDCLKKNKLKSKD